MKHPEKCKDDDEVRISFNDEEDLRRQRKREREQAKEEELKTEMLEKRISAAEKEREARIRLVTAIK